MLGAACGSGTMTTSPGAADALDSSAAIVTHDAALPPDSRAPAAPEDASATDRDSPALLGCTNARPPSAGLLLWLRAGVGVTLENGRVSAWADQGGGAPAAMANTDQRPTLVPNVLAGKPIVHFEGGRQALQRVVPINGLTQMTIAFVNATPSLWKDDPNEWCHHTGCDPKAGAGARVVSETGCSGTYQHVLWWDGIGDWTGVYLSPKQEEIGFRFGNGQKTYSPNPCNMAHDPSVAWPRPQSIAQSFSLTVAVHDGTTNRLYVHGQKVSETPTPGGAAIVKAGDRLDIGNGFGWVEGTNRGGDIGEVIVYDRALPDDERTTLEAYAHCSLFPEMAPH